MIVLASLAAASGVTGSIAGVRVTSAKRQRRSLVSYELRFPRGLESKNVEAFIGGLSGLLLPWWKRWLTTPFVSLETHASRVGIRHFLIVPAAWSASTANLLQASVPSVRYEMIQSPLVPLNIGAEYRLNDHRRPLRVEPAAVSAQLLASLQPLDDGEAIVVQWIVTPHAPVAPATVAGRSDGHRFWDLRAELPANAETTSASREKLLWASSVGNSSHWRGVEQRAARSHAAPGG